MIKTKAEVTAAADLARNREYLEAVEAAMAEVERLGEKFAPFNEDTVRVAERVIHARQMASAYLRFPVFDVRCLSRMKEVEIEFNINAVKNPRAILNVPAFAWLNMFHAGIVEWSPVSDQLMRLAGDTYISFEPPLIEKNRRSLAPIEAVIRQSGWGSDRLRATSPTIPKAVEEKARRLVNDFEDLLLVWDAEWTPAPLKDPLVLGRIGKVFFLLDQYDVTKLERYVASEMCRKS